MEFSEWMIVLGIFLANTIAGIVDIVGTICPYLTSYFHSIDSSILTGDVLSIASIGYIFEALSFLFMSYLSIYFREIYILMTFHLSCVAIFFLTAYIAQPYIFFALFGVAIGVISPFLSYLPVWIGWRNVKGDHKGFLAGVCSCAYVLSPLIYGMIFTVIVNPSNVEPYNINNNTETLFPEEVYRNVPDALLWTAIIILVTGLVAAALLFRKQPAEKKDSEKFTLTLVELFKQPSFWFLFSLLFLKMFYYVYLLNIYKVLGLTYLKDDHFVSMIGAVAFVSSAASKIIGGILLDKVAWRSYNLTTISIEIILCTMVPFCLTYKYLYGATIVMSLSIAGTSFTSLWIITEKTFPDDNWVISAVNISIFFVQFCINFVQSFITPHIGYQFTFLIIIGLQLTAFYLVFRQQELCKPFKKNKLLG